MHVGRRLLERLEHPVGGLVVQLVGVLDDEDAARRLERRPRRGGDDGLVDVADEDPGGARRRDPREVGMDAVLARGRARCRDRARRRRAARRRTRGPRPPSRCPRGRGRGRRARGCRRAAGPRRGRRGRGDDARATRAWAAQDVGSPPDGRPPGDDRGTRRRGQDDARRRARVRARRARGRGRPAARAGRRRAVRAHPRAREGSGAAGRRRGGGAALRGRARPARGGAACARCSTTAAGCCSTASSTPRSPTRAPARGLGVDRVRELNRFATGGLVPDRTLLLALDPAAGRARLAGRGEEPDRLEAEDATFFARVAAAYADLAREEPERIRRARRRRRRARGAGRRARGARRPPGLAGGRSGRVADHELHGQDPVARPLALQPRVEQLERGGTEALRVRRDGRERRERQAREVEVVEADDGQLTGTSTPSACAAASIPAAMHVVVAEDGGRVRRGARATRARRRSSPWP